MVATTSPEQEPALIQAAMTPELEEWLEKEFDRRSVCLSDHLVQPIPVQRLRTMQDHLFADTVAFYVRALQFGAYPPPAEAVFHHGMIWLTDGTHRTTAWVKLGWVHVPVRVYANVDDPTDLCDRPIWLTDEL